MVKKLPVKHLSENSKDLDKTLAEFSIVGDVNLKRLFNSALILTWILIITFVFMGLYMHVPIDILNISGGLTFLFYFFTSNELFRRFPNTVLTLWRRNLLKPKVSNHSFPNSQALKREDILEFFLETKRHLNNRAGLVFGILGFGISLWIVWLLDMGWIINFYDNLQFYSSGLLIVLFLRISILLSGFVGGMIGWRIYVIGRQISALATSFEIDLHVGHPDRCGGLSPIGDLSLMLAYCTAPFLVLISAWLIFANSLDISYLYMMPENIKWLTSTLQIFIFPLTAFGFLSFFYPLMSIHNSMLFVKSTLEIELDRIDQKIHLIELELLIKINDLPSEKRTILEENLAFLQRSHSRYDSIPTWPFRGGHLVRLTSTQIIPIIGMVSSAIEFIRSVKK